MQPPDRENPILREAVRQARAGNRVRARELFLAIVEEHPDHYVAWLWLVDLMDDLDDQIAALENALAVRPDLIQARARLEHLKRQREENLRRKARRAKQEVTRAKRVMKAGKRKEAIGILLNVVEEYENDETAWFLLSQLVDDEEDQIIALENVLTLNPKNKAARARLKTLRHFQRNPFDLATRYEEEGRFRKAIETYQKAALKATSNRELNLIYQRIAWLEQRMASGIRHIHPRFSILRLTPGPFLLYFALLMIHNGLNPFLFTPGLWLGMPVTLVGGFFVAVAAVRSHHPIWVKFFGEPGGSGSRLARIILSLVGWGLVGVAFGLLLLSSLVRMTAYYPPFGVP